jgi:hypothetical protein
MLYHNGLVLYHMAKTHVNGATNPFKLRNKPVQTAQQTRSNCATNPCKWGNKPVQTAQQTHVNGAKTD